LDDIFAGLSEARPENPYITPRAVYRMFCNAIKNYKIDSTHKNGVNYLFWLFRAAKTPHWAPNKIRVLVDETLLRWHLVPGEF